MVCYIICETVKIISGEGFITYGIKSEGCSVQISIRSERGT